MKKEDIINKFRLYYPTAEAVLDSFTPDNWAKALSNAHRLAEQPCITLAELDEVFACDGLALAVVKAQFDGLAEFVYKSATTSQANRKAAELFIGKYGRECSLYAMMIYFGSYFTDYKKTQMSFDIPDILQQFNKFLPRWNEKAIEPDEEEQQTEPAIPVKQWLRNRLAEGGTPQEIRAGGLYWTGVVTETMLAEAVAEINANAF